MVVGGCGDWMAGKGTMTRARVGGSVNREEREGGEGGQMDRRKEG